jgi:hypothetical protein
MGDNAINESVTIPIKDESNYQSGNENEAFQKAIRELGEALFLNYEDKTSNLTSKNIQGMIKIEALNDFMFAQYGFRYTELDMIVKYKKTLVVSQKAFGITQFIEALKAIQASFTQTEIPATMMQKLSGRR